MERVAVSGRVTGGWDVLPVVANVSCQFAPVSRWTVSPDINSRQTGGRRHGFWAVTPSWPMHWADLFERAADNETTVDAVRDTLTRHRGDDD